eukprot:7408024-Pyramimonas_sp.AAC.1
MVSLGEEFCGSLQGRPVLERMEGRVSMSYSVDAEEFDRVAIFVQPPRIRVDGTSFLRAPLQLDQHEMTTMNAKRRAKHCSG